MRRSLRSWLWRVPIEQEIDEEIALHIDLRTRELVDTGVAPGVAREMAIQKMGNLAAYKRTCTDLGRKRDREMNIALWLDELMEDLKVALRQLRGAPAFTAVAALTLALGIGANSAMFALVDATLLRPLPYTEPEQLVTLWETSSSTPRGLASPPNLVDWRERNRTFTAIAGYAPSVASMVMAGRDGSTETVSRQWVTSGIFDVFGVSPIAGRTFTADDEQQRLRAVVISEGLWETRFERSSATIGSEVSLDGELWTIVGVMPKTFEILGHTSMWAMRGFPPTMPPRARGAYQWQVVGRMKTGVAIDAAQSDLSAVADALSREYPKYQQGRTVTLEPLHATMIGGDLTSTSMLFLGVVGFVLLMCCANVANLLLARATARARELAVRSALGAGRRRIVRQLLTESLVLSSLGGALGLAVGAAILRAAPALIPDGLLPAAVALTFDARVVAFCAATALLVGVVFGLAPAYHATSTAPVEAMGADSRTTTGGSSRLRRLLVVSEVAAAAVLLVGAGLFLRTLVAVQSYDRGFRSDHVLTMVVDPLGSDRGYPPPTKQQQLYDQVEAEVRALPNVVDVAWASGLPLGESLFGEYPFHYDVVGDAPADPARRPTTNYQIVSASYFSTLELPIVAGRAFDTRDIMGSPRVMIVNEAFAKSLAPRQAVGLQLSVKPVDSPNEPAVTMEIVGVAKQVKQRPDEAVEFVQMYTPLLQDPFGDMQLMVKSGHGRPEALAPAVRAAIARVDRLQLVSVSDVTTLADVEWAAVGRHRFRAVMVGAFAVLAVVLAMVGVFGILAYSVQQRMRDFGVRRALGATSSAVVRLVVLDAGTLIGTGLAIGMAVSAASAQVVGSMLFGVDPHDPATFAAVAALLIAAAALSMAGPAWRAARVDPVHILRT